MPLPPLVSASDVVARNSELSAADNDRVAGAVEDASALIRDEAGATWVDDAGLLAEVPDIIRTITFEVARRALNRNGVDDVEGGRSDAGLFLKADEKRRINAAVASGSGTKPALWTLQTTRGDMSDVDFRPVEGGGDPLPWGYTGATPWNAP